MGLSKVMNINKVVSSLARHKQDFENFVNLQLSKSKHDNLAIITAFDTSHYRSGMQLISSLSEYAVEIDTYVVNLGLTKDQLKCIGIEFPNVKVSDFEYEKYPAFFDINNNAGSYAWKATIISTFLDKGYEHLLWLDAGNKLIGGISNIQKLIDKHGFFAVPTSNTISELTHPDSILRLDIDLKRCDQLQLSAAFIGFCLEREYVRELIHDWAFNSSIKEVICPNGSDRSNHRQDQSVFNLLIIQSSFLRKASSLILCRRYSANLHKILTHQDID